MKPLLICVAAQEAIETGAEAIAEELLCPRGPAGGHLMTYRARVGQRRGDRERCAGAGVSGGAGTGKTTTAVAIARVL